MLTRSLKFVRFGPSNQRQFATLTPSLTRHLKEQDPEVQSIIEKEKGRQKEWLNLIASENYTSLAVLEALGSVMQNKYSEGYPGARYYGGNEFIDMAERLCQSRALDLYELDKTKWGVNVQPLSGSPANFEVYTAVLQPHDRIMSLDLPHGGHLSHGYSTPTRKVSAVSVYFEVLPYRLDVSTGRIDYDKFHENALLYRPKLIVTGASAYPRHIDYARIKKIAEDVNCHLLVDMAHISGLVAAQAMPSPFPFADIVTTTTHKSLRGPRGAMIFYRKGVKSTDKKGKETVYDLEERINQSVFPGHQGGPHNHTITALAVALKQAKTEEFKQYGKQILSNCQQLASSLLDNKYALVSGGTDNHLVLVDLTDKGVNGAMAEKVLEKINISVNKNTVPGDKSAMNPHGIRLGTPALTTRGLVEKDIKVVADFIHRAIQISGKVKQEANGSTKISDFVQALSSGKFDKEVSGLRNEVVQFTQQFPVPAI